MRGFAIPFIPFLLAGCTVADGRYPSLAIRDVERAQGRFEAPPLAPLPRPEIPAVAGGDLAGELAQLGAQADASHQAFLAQLDKTTRLAQAASGAAVGSDAWASAQVALASLDSARSDTAISLASLDTLSIARTVDDESAVQVEAVRSRVLALIMQEDEALARLRGSAR